MKLGQFEIQNYIVNVNGADEDRKIIIYYNLQNEEVIRERYYDDPDMIPDSYTTMTGCPIRLPLWKFKAQLELTQATNQNFSNLRDQVDYIIQQLTGSNKVIVESAWNNANNITRLSPTVELIGNQLNLTIPQIDDIFISGSLIII